MEDDEFEGIYFEATATRVEVTKHYRVNGAPNMPGPHMIDQSKLYAPCVAKFTFVDGELIQVDVSAHPIKANGERANKYERIPGVYRDESTWPAWLVYLAKLAREDFKADRERARRELARV